jgi:hypothetical protein
VHQRDCHRFGYRDWAGVRGFDPAAKDMDPSEPFQFHGGRVTPTFDGTVYAVNGATLSSYESQTCTFAFVGP